MMIVTSLTWVMTILYWLSQAVMTSSKPLPPLCADAGASDLLALALSESANFPVGVQVMKVNGITGYRFDPEARLFGVDAAEVMTRCNYFPHEFSLILTFKREAPRNENEYLLTLLGQDRQTILVGVRLQRDTLHFEYAGMSDSQKKSTSVRSPGLAKGDWITAVITVTRKNVKFTLDCMAAVDIHLEKPFPKKLDTRGTRFHIASRRRRRGRFTGLLRQAKLIPGADASIPLCNKPQTSLVPSWLSGRATSSGAQSAVATVYIDDGNTEPLTCDESNRGRLKYTNSDQDLKLCEGDRWKKLASTQERLDYVTDFNDLLTKSKTLDIEIFRIPGEGLFLATANQGRNKNMDSTIYKWNSVNKTFLPHQKVQTDTARDWEHFSIESEHFLAVANQGTNESSPVANSVIYRWDTKRRKFIAHQFVPTCSARSWESFSIDGKHFLAVANYAGLDGHKEKSWLWLWDPSQRVFVKDQSIDTIGAYDFEYFQIGSDHYLAVANSYNGVMTNLDSVIYKWRGSNFVAFQYVETFGATDWEHFTIGGRHYLAVANYYDNNPNRNTYLVDSFVYEFREDIRPNQFVKLQDIPTHGALDFEFFTVGRDSFLISASSSDSNEDLVTVIYRWQGVEHFVPVHNITTNPCADWEDFTTDDGEHFLISANINSRTSKILQLLTY